MRKKGSKLSRSAELSAAADFGVGNMAGASQKCQEVKRTISGGRTQIISARFSPQKEKVPSKMRTTESRSET